MRILEEWEVERAVVVESGPQCRSAKARLRYRVVPQGPCLAWEHRENYLRDLEDVPYGSYLDLHLIFQKMNLAYAFLSLLMCDQSSTMLYFCQRHFKSYAFLSSIFIIDLITKLLLLSSWQYFLERKRLPSTILGPSLLYLTWKYYLGYRLDFTTICTSAKHLFKYSELHQAMMCTSAYMLSDLLRRRDVVK